MKVLKLALDLAWKELGNNCANHRQAAVGRDCWSRRMCLTHECRLGQSSLQPPKSQFCTTNSIFSWIWPCCSKNSSVPSLSQTLFGPLNTSVTHAMRQRLLSHAALRAVPSCGSKEQSHHNVSWPSGVTAWQGTGQFLTHAESPTGH